MPKGLQLHLYLTWSTKSHRPVFQTTCTVWQYLPCALLIPSWTYQSLCLCSRAGWSTAHDTWKMCYDVCRTRPCWSTKSVLHACFVSPYLQKIFSAHVFHFTVGDITPKEGISKETKARLEAEAMHNFVHDMLHNSPAAQRIEALWHVSLLSPTRIQAFAIQNNQGIRRRQDPRS